MLPRFSPPSPSSPPVTSRPAERDRVGGRREREREQREIDATPPQDQEADDRGQARDDDEREHYRQQDLVREPVPLREARRIGAVMPNQVLWPNETRPV